MNHDRIVIVTGMSRCGSSMTMKMLHAGGMPVVCDNFVSYELNDGRKCRVRRKYAMPPIEPGHWLGDCQGKAVKVLDPHVFQVPPGFSYDFVFCTRDANEQATSMVKFLKAMGIAKGTLQEIYRLRSSLLEEEPIIVPWLKDTYPTCRLMVMSFEQTLRDPNAQAERLNTFFGGQMDAVAMAAVVHRRDFKCLPNLDHELTA